MDRRSGHWWSHIASRTFTEHDWIENFRMSKQTFTYLCQQLSTLRQDTTMRKAITVEQRLAVTIWFLATPCEYRTIAQLFGIAHCTVCEIVQETCAAIVKSLLLSFLLATNSTVLLTASKQSGVYPSVLEQLMGAIFQ